MYQMYGKNRQGLAIYVLALFGLKMVLSRLKMKTEKLIGQNVIYAIAEIVFEGAKKVEIPLGFKNGYKYKITVEEADNEFR